jgi:putative FmdB family regulatory protein
MLYDYGCEICNYKMTDVYQSIKDEPLKECPNCGENGLSRVIYGGLGHFVKDVKTIGQAADSNWKKLGSYKRSEIESQSSAKRERENASAFSYAGGANKKEINKMTKEQKTRYIITGEK